MPGAEQEWRVGSGAQGDCGRRAAVVARGAKEDKLSGWAVTASRRGGAVLKKKMVR